ncbi:unnamed protein product [Hydatigera taeniaeformis]|uniref:SOCS box domain-containing protein n=1 Tax=Hydatigena taeniaeformis TaxID=6205 RepID=A0A3P7HKX0_HYDTA|nr:unnamed protein product [Hydatigera taeniaeformis]
MAGLCVHMLVNAPYKWNPLRTNILGATSLDLAMSNHGAYLPVVWPLAMASTHVYKDASSNPSLASLLLRPPITPLSPSLIVGICEGNVIDTEFATNKITLLFELIHCTPNLLMESWTEPEINRCTQCLAIGDTEEAICLKDQNKAFDFPVRYSCWLWHRYHATCEVPGQLNPLSLLSCCRVVIRRAIMNNLANSDLAMDYAKALKSLTLPPRMLAFLSFQEMWPVVNAKHKFRFRQRQYGALPLRHPLQPVYDVHDLDA